MSTDKDFYDQETLEGQGESYVAYVSSYIENWLKHIRRHFAGRSDVRILDLGAGSCTTSLLISREAFVGSIMAADISIRRMQEMVKQTHAVTGGDMTKLEFTAIDFNDLLPIPDNSFDMVVMDASLHHSRNIWQTLAEIRRVLIPEGFFIAQREAYTSPLTHKITFRRLLASPEVAAGVSENAYLKSQYNYYLRANGFLPRFIAVLPGLRFKLLFFANGWLFSKYNIVARSTKKAAA